ncbi:MAG: hypothetical protein KC646_05530 [Candidatus Cloacimonetes bacterium]|nr:hypothetical protein [Candidatus Cloacimonadota bacterium]
MFMHFHKRKDTYSLLSSYNHHQFKLDQKIWPSVDHYLECKKILNNQYLAKLRQKHFPVPTKITDLNDLQYYSSTKAYEAIYQKFVVNISLNDLLFTNRNIKPTLFS